MVGSNTGGRSSLVVLPESELRDILVVFSDIFSPTDFFLPTTEARYIPYAGGRLRYIEIYANATQPRVDVEDTAGTLLHELGHALGCCSGPGTVSGHFVGVICTRILCALHRSAKTFSEEELSQMGLGR